MKDHGHDIIIAPIIIIGLLILVPLVFWAPKLVSFVLSAGLFHFGYGQIKAYKTLNNWVTIKGRLQDISLAVYRVSESKYSPPTPYYFPDAKYSYEYAGETYSGDRYSFDKKSIWSKSQADIEEIIATLKDKQDISVYINPTSPNQSALDISISNNRLSHSYALISASAVIAILGLYLVFKI